MKNNKWKVALLSLLSITVASVTFAVSIDNSFGPDLLLNAKTNRSNSYHLSLSSFDENENTGIVNTSDGNSLSFSYDGYSSSAGHWGTIEDGGYLLNSSMISGLESISIDFVTETTSLTVSYGWYEDDYVVNDGAISSDNSTYSFKDEKPSFLKISNSSGEPIVINSIQLSYSCSVTPLPEDYNKILYTYISENGGYYRVSGYKSGITKANIPSTYNDKPVKEIWMNAFSGCTTLTTVNINYGLWRINQNAFRNCTALSSISIPNSISTIENGVFQNCSSLTRIDIPASVTTISDSFRGCTSLQEINVDANNSVFSSDDGVLFNKDKTMLIFWPLGKTGTPVIPSSVTTIGSYAFYNRTSLTSITIPNTVTKIYGSAFYECTSLASITIPDTVTYLGSSSFERCSSLKTIDIPSSVTYLGSYAFAKCSKLNTVNLNANITSIESYTFDSCSALKNITIPDTVETIRSFAFSYTNLSSIIIPESVSSIDSTAFRGCSSLEEFVVDENNECYSSVSGILYNKEQTSMLICPKKVAGIIDIPYGITSIGDSLFEGCNNIIAIYIPSSVQSIGANAFKSCSSLSIIYIPSSATSIASTVFLSCGHLISILYGGTENQWNSFNITTNSAINGSIIEYDSQVTSFTKIDTPLYSYILTSDNCVYNFVYKDNSIHSFSFGSQFDGLTIKTIGDNAFQEFSNLESVTIPDTVLYIGTYAFWSTNISNITIPNSVRKIGSLAFGSCLYLTSIVIPDTVDFIGSSAFASCISLASINIPSAISTIYKSTFDNCKELTSVVIPEGVTRIETNAFSRCKKLVSVSLPSTLTYIGFMAFGDCDLLESIVIPDSVTSFGGNIFLDSDILNSIYFEGNESEWNSISSVSSITISNVFYYSETAPAEPGPYWHYVNDVPTLW